MMYFSRPKSRIRVDDLIDGLIYSRLLIDVNLRFNFVPPCSS
jgi:hypothetical protein